MIVSHSRKFIFIKSVKTAGTSLETALSNFCEGQDVVTPLGDYKYNRDETGRWQHRSMNSAGFHQHADAAEVRAKVGEEVWNEYFKFSIARNPWDRMVSMFLWKTKHDPNKKSVLGMLGKLGLPVNELTGLRSRFGEFLRGGFRSNDRFYCDGPQLCVDFVIRYETLAEDTLELCRRIGIPAIELPRLKAGFRPGEYHYSEYYDEASRAEVGETHRNDLHLFGYEFEQVSYAADRARAAGG